MKKLYEYPAHEINGIKYKRGRVKPFGASLVGYDVVNFSVFSKNAKSCELLLYTLGEKNRLRYCLFPRDSVSATCFL